LIRALAWTNIARDQDRGGAHAEREVTRGLESGQQDHATRLSRRRGDHGRRPCRGRRDAEPQWPRSSVLGGPPPQTGPDYYPPTQTGLKGQPDDVVSQFVALDGKPNQKDVHSTRGGTGIKVKRIQDTGEVYDCVIVGAGASGLAAAKFYQDRFGPDSKIL
jgi:hypothetical protein